MEPALAVFELQQAVVLARHVHRNEMLECEVPRTFLKLFLGVGVLLNRFSRKLRLHVLHAVDERVYRFHRLGEQLECRVVERLEQVHGLHLLFPSGACGRRRRVLSLCLRRAASAPPGLGPQLGPQLGFVGPDLRYEEVLTEEQKHRAGRVFHLRERKHLLHTVRELRAKLMEDIGLELAPRTNGAELREEEPRQPLPHAGSPALHLRRIGCDLCRDPCADVCNRLPKFRDGLHESASESLAKA
mmetsp:Transcript_21318/g.59482  ORF Transcript_21318/g.59482 Transcript_21318/m.59482 type:complete len:244 (-) Transcript_21318:592-1323(-)